MADLTVGRVCFQATKVHQHASSRRRYVLKRSFGSRILVTRLRGVRPFCAIHVVL